MSIENIIAAYKNCKTESERQAFLELQRSRIGQLSQEESRAEIAQIATNVQRIEALIEDKAVAHH